MAGRTLKLEGKQGSRKEELVMATGLTFGYKRFFHYASDFGRTASVRKGALPWYGCRKTRNSSEVDPCTQEDAVVSCFNLSQLAEP